MAKLLGWVLCAQERVPAPCANLCE